MENITTVLISTAIAAAALVAGFAINLVVSFLLYRRHSRTPITLRSIPLKLEYWRAPLRLIIPILALSLTLPFLRFPDWLTSILGHAISLCIIAAIAWLVVRSLAIARDMILSSFDIATADNLQARRVYTQLRLFERVLAIIVVIVAIAIMLMTFQSVRQIGMSILASAGVLGLVIGFAAQKSLATILAGVQIAITQPIRLGDAVVIEDEWGWIEEITLTYVVVKLWDQRRLIVPITQFMEKTFQNWTRTTAQLIGPVFIYADYTLPISALREEARRIVASTELWDGHVFNVQVTNTSSEGMEIRLLASAADSPKAWDLRCYAREKLIDFITTHFPGSLPRTRVRLDRDETSRDAEFNDSLFTSAR